MAEQKQDDQLEHTYSSSVRIRDVSLKTCQRRWTLGRSGEGGSGISVLAAGHDDDEDDDDDIYICVCVCVCVWHWETFKKKVCKWDLRVFILLSLCVYKGDTCFGHTSPPWRFNCPLFVFKALLYSFLSFHSFSFSTFLSLDQQQSLYIYIYIYIVSKVGDRSRGRPKGSLFNSYYTEVLRRALLLSLCCLTRSLYCWVLSKYFKYLVLVSTLST